MKNVSIVIVLVALMAVVGGYLIWNQNKTATAKQTPAPEVSQKISQDDSIGTIESELDKTEILEEDFSDIIKAK